MPIPRNLDELNKLRKKIKFYNHKINGANGGIENPDQVLMEIGVILKHDFEIHENQLENLNSLTVEFFREKVNSAERGITVEIIYDLFNQIRHIREFLLEENKKRVSTEVSSSLRMTTPESKSTTSIKKKEENLTSANILRLIVAKDKSKIWFNTAEIVDKIGHLVKEAAQMLCRKGMPEREGPNRIEAMVAEGESQILIGNPGAETKTETKDEKSTHSTTSYGTLTQKVNLSAEQNTLSSLSLLNPSNGSQLTIGTVIINHGSFSPGLISKNENEKNATSSRTSLTEEPNAGSTAVLPAPDDRMQKALKTYYRSRGGLSSPLFPSYTHPVAEISLSIVEWLRPTIAQTAQPVSDNKATKSSDATLTYYEKLHNLQKCIPVADMFDKVPNEHGDFDIKPVKRLLISGVAGTGKTSFCQHIAYCWAEKGLWHDKIDYVFWLPLQRLLMDLEEKPDLVTAIQQFCLEDTSDVSSPEIESLFRDPHRRARTLVICDGFDEIAHVFQDTHHPLTKLLTPLFKSTKGYLILTSRPHQLHSLGESLSQFERQLQNNGFSDTHIIDYVTRYFNVLKPAQPTVANRLLASLRRNPSVWGTAHTPLHLALLCDIHHLQLLEQQECATQQLSSEEPTYDVGQNITALYREMTKYLLKRYLKNRKETETFNWSSSQIYEHCALELEFLGRLALAGLQKQSIWLSVSLQNQVLNEMVKHKGTPPLLLSALQAGFLNGSADDREDIQKPHTFIHLTFQEFLAAHYLYMQFKHSPDILKKYQVELRQYDNLALFLAGLFKQPKEREYFFNALMPKPWYEKTVLSETDEQHLLLTMRCLDACCDEEEPFNQKSALLKFYKNYILKTLLRETQIFPSNLKNKLYKQYQRLLESLRRCPALQAELGLQNFLNVLKGKAGKSLTGRQAGFANFYLTKDTEQQGAALLALATSKTADYETCQRVLRELAEIQESIPKLEDAWPIFTKDPRLHSHLIKCYAQLLPRNLNFLDCLFIELREGTAAPLAYAVLKHSLHSLSAEYSSNPKSLQQDTSFIPDLLLHHSLMQRLTQVTKDLLEQLVQRELTLTDRSSIVRYLCWLYPLNPIALQQMIRRTFLITVFNPQIRLCHEIAGMSRDLESVFIEHLHKYYHLTGTFISRYAEEILRLGNISLPITVENRELPFSFIYKEYQKKEMLYDSHFAFYDRGRIEQENKMESVNSSNVYSLLVDFLNKNRVKVLTLLGHCTQKDDRVLKLLTDMIKDPDITIQQKVVQILILIRLHEALIELDEPQDALAAFFWYQLADTKSPLLREKAARALGERGNNDPRILIALRHTLSDADEDVREAAIEALIKLGEPQDALVAAFLRQLADAKSSLLQMKSAEALGKIGNKEPRILTTLHNALSNADEYVQSAVIKALIELGEPEDTRIAAALRQLADAKSWFVLKTAAEALGKRGNNDPQILTVLRNALSNAYEDVRWAAIEALIELGEPKDTLVAAFLRQLADAKFSLLRMKSAEALGKIGNKDPQILTALSNALSDANDDVREAVIEALIELDAEDTFIAAFLHQLADIKSSLSRKKAAEALGKRGNNDPRILPALRHALGDADEDVRGAAIEALIQLGEPQDTLVAAILRQLSDAESWSWREKAAEALGKIGNKDPRILSALRHALSYANDDVREAAIEALIKLGERQDALVVAFLYQLSYAKSSLLRVKAARALGKSGNKDPQILTALRHTLNDFDEDVRGAAIEALIKLGERQDIVVAFLRQLADEPFSLWRKKAAEALGKIGNKDPQILTALRNALSDVNEDVWWAAIEALDQLGEPEDVLVAAILRQLSDAKSWSWRKKAAEDLGKRGNKDPRILSALRHALSDADGDVCGAAIEALIELGEPEGALVDAILCQLSDEKSWFWRKKAAEALGKRGNKDPRILTALRNALSNANENVREAAIEVSIELGEAQDILVAALLRQLVDAKSLLLRKKAAEALGKIGNNDPRILTALRHALSDADEVVREAVIKSLRQLNALNPALLAYCLPLLTDLNNRLQQLTTRTQQDLHYPIVKEILLEALYSPDYYSKSKFIIDALAEIDPNISPMLFDILKSPNIQLWQAAVHKLIEINPSIMTQLFERLEDPLLNNHSVLFDAIGSCIPNNPHILEEIHQFLQRPLRVDTSFLRQPSSRFDKNEDEGPIKSYSFIILFHELKKIHIHEEDSLAHILQKIEAQAAACFEQLKNFIPLFPLSKEINTYHKLLFFLTAFPYSNTWFITLFLKIIATKEDGIVLRHLMLAALMRLISFEKSNSPMQLDSTNNYNLVTQLRLTLEKIMLEENSLFSSLATIAWQELPSVVDPTQYQIPNLIFNKSVKMSQTSVMQLQSAMTLAEAKADGLDMFVIAESYHSLAVVLLNLKSDDHTELAMQYYQRSLAIYERHLEKDHPHIKTLQNNLHAIQNGIDIKMSHSIKMPALAVMTVSSSSVTDVTMRPPVKYSAETLSTTQKAATARIIDNPRRSPAKAQISEGKDEKSERIEDIIALPIRIRAKLKEKLIHLNEQQKQIIAQYLKVWSISPSEELSTFTENQMEAMVEAFICDVINEIDDYDAKKLISMLNKYDANKQILNEKLLAKAFEQAEKSGPKKTATTSTSSSQSSSSSLYNPSNVTWINTQTRLPGVELRAQEDKTMAGDEKRTGTEIVTNRSFHPVASRITDQAKIARETGIFKENSTILRNNNDGQTSLEETCMRIEKENEIAKIRKLENASAEAHSISLGNGSATFSSGKTPAKSLFNIDPGRFGQRNQL